jgi:hypothetical protein
MLVQILACLRRSRPKKWARRCAAAAAAAAAAALTQPYHYRTRARPAQGSVVALEPLPPTFAALEHNVALHRDWCAASGRPCAPVALLNRGAGDGASAEADFTLYPRAAGWATLSRHESEGAVLADMEAYLENALREGSPALSAPARWAGGALRRAAPPLYRAVARAAVRRMLGAKQAFRCGMTTVSEVIERQGLARVALLKVDVERAELEVLRGVHPAHWPRVAQAAVEVHEAALPEALALLRGAAGFAAVAAEQRGAMAGTGIHMVYCTRRA